MPVDERLAEAARAGSSAPKVGGVAIRAVGFAEGGFVAGEGRVERRDGAQQR